MARPPIQIDMDQLKALMRLKPTMEDCAAFFGCSPDTIERRIREAEDCSYAEFREKGMVHTRMHLVRTALKRAEKSDTMLIFCLKNLCSWRDKQADEDAPAAVVNNVQVTDEQLKNLIRAARGDAK